MADFARPALSSPGGLVPVGVWIRVRATEVIQVVGFTYVDPQAGFSAQGWRIENSTLDETARVVVRLSKPDLVWEPLSSAEIQRLELELPPTWVLECYGPQPPAGTLWGTWRNHPKLKGRLLLDHPDDLQILVHDGGPRISANAPEAVWASVVGVEGEDGDVFRARILNQPFHLETVGEGSEIRFMVTDAERHPLMVTEKYLEERPDWDIHPCNKCGFSELFDAPSDLIKVVFPHLGHAERLMAFTAVCPVCGGAQAVEPRYGMSSQSGKTGESSAAKRPWWRVWG